MHPMTGHLFVMQGDLTRLACDAVVVPCDSALNVTRGWQPLLPPDLPDGDNDWLRLPGAADEHGVVELPSAGTRRTFALVTVEDAASPQDVVDRTWQGLTRIARDLQAHDRRHIPLIGLPLVGTGAGGLDTRRGEVVAALLEAQRTRALPVDLALVLNDRRDFAATQARRNEGDWPTLSQPSAPDGLISQADRLGGLAARGELSLFLGAGVSLPAGLPDWWTLLDRLAAAAGCAPPERDQDPYDAATPIIEALGDSYHEVITRELDSTRRHAVGHALLASLRLRQMVTTNFDSCAERALEPLHPDGVRVMTRQVPTGDRPWLLKLHGDIQRPHTLVLTTAEREAHHEHAAALRGVVQGLMLTSHLLFVGYSLADKSFLDLAQAVTTVRAQADEPPDTAGTALALSEDDVRTLAYQELTMVPMARDASGAEAARRLEIFLDRLVWRASTHHDLAAEYLLDDRYASSLGKGDLELRDALSHLREVGPAAKDSAAWRRIAQALKELGGDI